MPPSKLPETTSAVGRAVSPLEAGRPLVPGSPGLVVVAFVVAGAFVYKQCKYEAKGKQSAGVDMRL